VTEVERSLVRGRGLRQWQRLRRDDTYGASERQATRGRASPLSRPPGRPRESTAMGETFARKRKETLTKRARSRISSPSCQSGEEGEGEGERKSASLEGVRGDGNANVTRGCRGCRSKRRGTRTSRRDVTSTLRRPVVGWRRCHPDGRPGGAGGALFRGVYAQTIQPRVQHRGRFARIVGVGERPRENPPLSLSLSLSLSLLVSLSSRSTLSVSLPRALRFNVRRASDTNSDRRSPGVAHDDDDGGGSVCISTRG